MASRPYTQQSTGTRLKYSTAVAPENLTEDLQEPAHKGSQQGQPQQGPGGAMPAEHKTQALGQTALPAICQLLFASPSQLSSNCSQAKRRAVALESQAGGDNRPLSALQQVGVSSGSQPAGAMSSFPQVASDASQQFTEAHHHHTPAVGADLSSMQASESSAAVGRHSAQDLPWPGENQNASSRLNCSQASHQCWPGNEPQTQCAGDAAKHTGSGHSGAHLLELQRQAAPASRCTHAAAGDLAIAAAGSINRLMAPMSQRSAVSQQQTRAGDALVIKFGGIWSTTSTRPLILIQ